MTGTNMFKRSAAAAVINTDTVIATPAPGQKIKILGFWVANEGAAQTVGMNFELRYGANVLASVGFDSATAPIGQTSKSAIMNDEIICDGVNAIQARNLTALAASSNVAYNVAVEVTLA